MKELQSSAIGRGDVKMVSIRAVIFVVLQYLTAPQSSFFSCSNINDGGAWKIPSLGIVIVCLPGPFIDQEGQERRLGTSQLRKGKRKDLKTATKGVT